MQPRHSQRREPAAAGSRAMAAQRPVLVIAEDHAATRALLQEVLEEEGHVVEAFADGVSALTRLGAHTAAAIILDWQLPDVQGVLVCRAIRGREQGARPPLPIVVL